MLDVALTGILRRLTAEEARDLLSQLPGQARARLQAAPRNKQVGYYSDMYKLEFAWPKFQMYRQVLSRVLAEDFVIDRGWTETQALDFGKQVLRGNVETVFGV